MSTSHSNAESRINTDEIEPILPQPFTPSLSSSVSDSESIAVVQELVAGSHPVSADTLMYVYRAPQSAQRAKIAIPLAVDGEEDEVVDVDDEGPYEEDVGLQHFWPVLLDHRQWGQRGPALDWRRATLQQKKALVEKCGYPFAWIQTGVEHLRSASLT